MRRLNILLVSSTTTAFAVILYLVCVAFRLVFPGWAMYELDRWVAIFPGFSWSILGVTIGLIEIAAAAALGSALYAWLYNALARRLVSRGAGAELPVRAAA
jgi:hypothetical protein